MWTAASSSVSSHCRFSEAALVYRVEGWNSPSADFSVLPSGSPAGESPLKAELLLVLTEDCWSMSWYLERSLCKLAYKCFSVVDPYKTKLEQNIPGIFFVLFFCSWRRFCGLKLNDLFISVVFLWVEQNQSADLGELRLAIIYLHTGYWRDQLKTHRPCSDLLSTSVLIDPITSGQLLVSI